MTNLFPLSKSSLICSNSLIYLNIESLTCNNSAFSACNVLIVTYASFDWESNRDY